MGTNHPSGFHILDYVVFLLVLAISFGFGIYQAIFGKTNTTTQYLMGGRKLHIIPTALSLLISYISAISILGSAAETYCYGIAFCGVIVGYAGVYFLTMWTFVPLFYPLQLTSITEYVNLRYRSKSLMYICTVVQVFSYILLNGITLFAIGLMLQAMTDVPLWASIASFGLLATIYTSIGGLKAVVWSDAFQCVVIFGSLFTIIVIGSVKVGGLSNVWTIYAEYERLEVQFSPFHRSSIFAFTIGWILTFWPVLGTSQITMQRICALPTLQAAKRSFLVTIPVCMAIQFLTCVCGIVVFAYFSHIGCDPLASGKISSPNQLLPFYITTVLNFPPIPGVFVACVVCGSLSTISSCLSSVSALVWEDILSSHLAELSEQRKALVTKCITFVAGLLIIAFGFVAGQLSGTLVQMTASFISISFTPIIVIMVSGMISPWPNVQGVSFAAVAGFCVTSWLCFGSIFFGDHGNMLPSVTSECTDFLMDSNITDNILTSQYVVNQTSTTQTLTTLGMQEDYNSSLIYNISYAWYSPCGVIVGIATAILLSFIPVFSEKPFAVDRKYLFHFLRRCYNLKQEDGKAYLSVPIYELNDNSKKITYNPKI